MIRIGPAGSGLANIDGLKKLLRSGLNALEVEFTYGVWMKDKHAKKLGSFALKNDIALSVHAPYYINLASMDRQKLLASKKRIKDSCRLAESMGAGYVVFHAGYYQGRDKKEVYNIIRKELEKLADHIKKRRWKVKLAPETTGKKSQFGDIDELLKLRKQARTDVCVDFSHILARNGSIDYREIFTKLKDLNHVHAHFSGIVYSKKGELRHKRTPTTAVKALLEEAVKQKQELTIINESPVPFKDSIKTLKIYREMLT